MSRKVDFWPNLPDICNCPGKVRNQGHTSDILKFLPRTNKQLLKVSSSQSKSCFQYFHKASANTCPLSRARVNGFYKSYISLLKLFFLGQINICFQFRMYLPKSFKISSRKVRFLHIDESAPGDQVSFESGSGLSNHDSDSSASIMPRGQDSFPLVQCPVQRLTCTR